MGGLQLVDESATVTSINDSDGDGLLHDVGSATGMGIRPRMNTSTVGYGRCSGCKELKHVMVDGTVAEHNGYDTEGTSVAVVRCAGSGRPPVAEEEETAPASS